MTTKDRSEMPPANDPPRELGPWDAALSQLREWDPAWDRYAERAVHGRWAESGTETFARRRGGLTPETPVRSVKE